MNPVLLSFEQTLSEKRREEIDAGTQFAISPRVSRLKAHTIAFESVRVPLTALRLRVTRTSRRRKPRAELLVELVATLHKNKG